MKKFIITSCCSLLLLSSCDSFFDTKLTNEKTEQQLTEQTGVIRGLITFAYRSIPTNFDSFGSDFLDCATDNALSNNLNGNMNKMSGQDGYWTDVNSPLNNWNAAYENIRNLNEFLRIGTDEDLVYMATNPEENEAYRKRITGEAYFLRAWNEFELLRRFSGIDVNGELLGFPIVTENMDIDNIEMKPRDSFSDCVKRIVEDLDLAFEAGLPIEYTGDNAILGSSQLGRPSKIACMALKTRVLLYAASPLYNLDNKNELYEEAAAAAKAALDMIGTTLPDIYDLGNISSKFYNNITTANNEVILRRVAGDATGELGMAQRNFPPAVGLIGQGKCNPSQNLVDAFPMANGYPITADQSLSNYNPENPFAGRDKRLSMTVLKNGDVFKGVTIQTYNGGNCMPGAVGVDDKNTTRTGYFLRKWQSSKANLIAGNQMKDFFYYALIRKVEVFLNFAEAANMAYGPDNNVLGYTARQAIREVRRRAGIASSGDDKYLSSLRTKEELMELIKNERRIELCFENHRFFDLRRWKENLNEPVKGIIYSDANDKKGTISIVQSPVYKDYMYYGPIPKAEILKCPAITQNQGW